MNEIRAEKNEIRNSVIEECALELETRARGLRVMGEQKQASETDFYIHYIRALKNK